MRVKRSRLLPPLKKKTVIILANNEEEALNLAIDKEPYLSDWTPDHVEYQREVIDGAIMIRYHLTFEEPNPVVSLDVYRFRKQNRKAATI